MTDLTTDPTSSTLLHEDSALIAVSKPEGLATIPERDLSVPSLQRALEAQRGERLWVVHRLDKEVSGLVVFARTAAAHRSLSMAFEHRQVEKSYTVTTHGVIADDRGVIDRPIAEFGSGRMGVDARRGKPAQTAYTVTRRAAGHTLVEVRPQTGRRHQIRVHFYALGHPLVGDPRYGDLKAQAAFARLMLHARTLKIAHPDGSELSLEAPLPPSFTRQLEALGLGAR